MSIHKLLNVRETSELIKDGHILLLAGDEKLLRQLPSGQWVAGTSANFLTPEGGISSQDLIFVSDISEHAVDVEIRSYSSDELRHIATNYPENGFTVLIIPCFSEVLGHFARQVQNYPGVFDAPLFGWISGVAISEIGQQTPKVFAGSAAGHDNRAVVMHVTIHPELVAEIDIINLFLQGDGEDIEFDTEGFESRGMCRIGGKEHNLARYIAANHIDTRRPLVADYNGAMINVSIHAVDMVAGRVEFPAPVFRNIKYRFAKPVPDYMNDFRNRLKQVDTKSIVISCNCILNYLYAELEGKSTHTAAVSGPSTFGEIAYMLLNQTLVYLSIRKEAA